MGAFASDLNAGRHLRAFVSAFPSLPVVLEQFGKTNFVLTLQL